jgi:hypothetical protein
MIARGHLVTIQAAHLLPALHRHPLAQHKGSPEPATEIHARFITTGLTEGTAWITLDRGRKPLRLGHTVSVRVSACHLLQDGKPITTTNRLSPADSIALLNQEMANKAFYRTMRDYARKCLGYSLDHQSLSYGDLDQHLGVDEYCNELIQRAYLKTHSAFSKVGYAPRTTPPTTAPYLKISMQSVSKDYIEQIAAEIKRKAGEVDDDCIPCHSPSRSTWEQDESRVTARPTQRAQRVQDEDNSTEAMTKVLREVVQPFLDQHPDQAAATYFKQVVFGGFTSKQLSEAIGGALTPAKITRIVNGVKADLMQVLDLDGIREMMGRRLAE